ncbi:hypothetical protein DVH24_021183 [Malus domestica]|uniref:DUF4216 domain-containing protein n=1 Tax=Malus domestica TaxID=3750 RepID=A0A498J9J9_MALDO|nr:hypothetical protein DVH24_021183 [Malus domestica]
MAKQIFYLVDPKGGSGWKVIQKFDQIGLYDILELDHDDNDDNVADQQLSSSIEIVPDIEIPIELITINLRDLPRYNAPEEANEDEDEWEFKNNSSEDSDSYYCSSDKD